jgi:hypothetical protein
LTSLPLNVIFAIFCCILCSLSKAAYKYKLLCIT